MKLMQSYITRNRCYTNGTKITVRGLMLHSVGTPQPKAGVFINNWNNAGAAVSVHAFIEQGGNVYQILPWNYKAWHCGSSGNATHIGVEMTEPSTIRYTGGSSFNDLNPAATKAFVLDTYKTAVELFAHLCKQYGLNPTGSGVIVSHAEGYRRGIASNHGDVEHIWKRFGLTMDQFRQDVKNTMVGGTASVKVEPDANGCPYVAPPTLVWKGSTGEGVQWVQWYLTKLGYSVGSIDGICGSRTVDAIRQFQSDHASLTVDGIVGSATRTALEAAYTAKYGKKEDDDMTESQVRKLVQEMLAGEGTAVSNWAKEEFAEAKERGITDGTNPQGYATREQVAAMVLRGQKGAR